MIKITQLAVPTPAIILMAHDFFSHTIRLAQEGKIPNTIISVPNAINKESENASASRYD